jgi:hypothetical protein
MPSTYRVLDAQLRVYADRLIADVGLKREETGKLATLIASEVRFLDPAVRKLVLDASPVRLRDRLDELRAFQAWSDLVGKMPHDPEIIRAQVIVQNYVCFVYLGEACFRVLRTRSNPGSVTRLCCKYPTDNPVRAFRNAIAHSNWAYRDDFSGLVYWAMKGSEPDEAPTRFEVTQRELDFWQSLSRCVAYAAYTVLESVEGR